MIDSTSSSLRLGLACTVLGALLLLGCQEIFTRVLGNSFQYATVGWFLRVGRLERRETGDARPDRPEHSQAQ